MERPESCGDCAIWKTEDGCLPGCKERMEAKDDRLLSFRLIRRRGAQSKRLAKRALGLRAKLRAATERAEELRAQAEMLAGAILQSEWNGHDRETDEYMCPFCARNEGVPHKDSCIVTAIRSSLPTAGERWAKMQAVCEQVSIAKRELAAYHAAKKAHKDEPYDIACCYWEPHWYAFTKARDKAFEMVDDALAKAVTE